MRLRGHPVHVMLVHFPVALWPCHAALHLFAKALPAGVAGIAGFWSLAVGTALGWFAAGCGLLDLLQLQQEGDRRRLTDALWHGGLNGFVLVAFSALLAIEKPTYPAINHGTAFLAGECGLLVVLGIGNFLGGEVVWGKD